MWPQQLQQTIFDIRGLPPPLQLTSGNDLGGLETSLLAYCVAFNVDVPNWKIEWNAPSQPCFRLLPATGPGYTAFQLLAVFRALRYNSFFKAISFEGVDMTSLAGKTDPASQGESLVYTSASRKLPFFFFFIKKRTLAPTNILFSPQDFRRTFSCAVRSYHFRARDTLLALRRRFDPKH